MATLQTLRNKGGVFISIFIGLALLAFILTDLLGSGNSVFSDRDTVGTIDGQDVKALQYQQLVDEYEAFTKMNRQSLSLGEDEQNQIRESVWNQLISEAAFGKTYENAGIAVTANELIDMAIGNHISPSVRPLFTNPQTGVYDRAIAENFLRNKNSDPQAAFYWSFVEKAIKDERLLQKYMGLVRKSLYCTSAQTDFEVAKRDKNVDMSFVSVRYTSIPDSTLTIPESEIKARYEKNKERYKTGESRSIEYVTFPVRPTEEDREATEKYVADLKADFSAPETDAYRFAQMNAETPQAERFMKPSQLSTELSKFVETAAVGDVYGPYREGDTYKISRLVAIEQRPDSVKARHILISNNPELADSLFNRAKAGDNFADLARRFSQDPGSAINGGDLDWFTDGVMVPEFNAACFEGKKGDIVKVDTQFGTHIINIQDKGVPMTKYSIATIDKSIQYSSKTHQDVYAQANQFAVDHTTQAAFNAAIDTMNLVKRYGNNIRSNAYTINAVRPAREIVKWAYGANVGDVSPLFECGDEFVLAVLVKIQDKGYTPLEDLRQLISRDIMNELKTEQVAKAVAGKSLQDIAAMYNSKVDSASNVSFGQNSITGAGSEPSLIGSALAAQQGALVGPVKGNNAAYMFTVNAVKESATDAEASKATARNAYLQQFGGLEYQISNSIIESVEVEDKRLNLY